MKILILSTGDNHGAYEAAYKIAKFLFEANHKVILAVKVKTKTDPFIVKISPLKESLIKVIITKIKNRIRKILHFNGSNAPFSTEPKYLFLTGNENKCYITGERILNQIKFIPDLIIAGMTDGFCTTNSLSELYEISHAKIYTWLVDMAPMTGGCHYAWNCKGYEIDCTNCPAIIERNKKCQANRNLRIKHKNIQSSGIRVLSGSSWVTEQAKQSFLFKFQKTIHNTSACIDTRIFNGNNRDIAKQVFKIPQESKVIFSGSWNIHDPRKGISYFIEALKDLWNLQDTSLRQKTFIFIAGEHYGRMDFMKSILYNKMHIDYITDYRLLALAYQASDIFVCPSIEDSGPMMVCEALACGTPVVGFRMGNIYSMVETGYNGYVAELMNSSDLAYGLRKILTLSKEEFNIYSKNAIEKIEKSASHHFAVDVIESLFNDN